MQMSDRGIPASLLELPRFTGRIRIDDKGNTVFPHFDRDGLCGYSYLTISRDFKDLT